MTPQTYKVMRTIFTASGAVGALDSMAVVLIGTYASMAGILGSSEAAWWASAGIAALFTVAYAYSIDYGLHVFIPATFEGLARRDYGGKGKFYFLMMLFIAAQLAATVGITLWGRNFTVEAATPPPRYADVAEAEQRGRDATSAQVAILQGEISALERDARRASAAVPGSNPRLSELAATGNAWAQQTLDKKKRWAEERYRKHVDEKRALITTLLTADAENRSKVVAGLTSQNEAALAGYTRRKEALSAMATWIAVAAAFFMVLSGLIMALYVASGYPLPHGQNRRRKTWLETDADSDAETEAENLRKPAPGQSSGRVDPAAKPAAKAAAKSAVITSFHAKTDAEAAPENEVVITTGEIFWDLDAFRFYEDSEGRILRVESGGKVMDKTKLQEYAKTYEKRAETEHSGAATRELNTNKALSFKKALQDIHGIGEVA